MKRYARRDRATHFREFIVLRTAHQLGRDCFHGRLVRRRLGRPDVWPTTARDGWMGFRDIAIDPQSRRAIPMTARRALTLTWVEEPELGVAMGKMYLPLFLDGLKTTAKHLFGAEGDDAIPGRTNRRSTTRKSTEACTD